MQVFDFDQLGEADLRVDAIYQGGRGGNAGDDPFPRLLGLSNQGGFRYRGTLNAIQLLVLTSSLADREWPDRLDHDTGIFIYYGDNKKPGRELHNTPRHGNEILRDLFSHAHGGPAGRAHVPPVLLFGNTGTWRDVRFLGLAVPGAPSLALTEDLVAVWKSVEGRRFQNYRAHFTVLDTPKVSRAWLRDIASGETETPNAPRAWRTWRGGGSVHPLIAPRALEHRSKAEQLPERPEHLALLQVIVDHFSSRPHDFEACAAALTRMLLPNVTTLELTRPSRDGGRDGVGRMRVGRAASSIDVEFALEAKCYSIGNGVGVREVSRLISRMRHRQFGILVTTSFLDSQAYQEIKEDGHPVVVVAGRDLIDLLVVNGIGELRSLERWLQQDFPARKQ